MLQMGTPLKMPDLKRTQSASSLHIVLNKCKTLSGSIGSMDIPLKQMNKSAIILVGSTGTGKSSTIKKCTGHDVIVGDGYQSVTKCCEVFL